MILGRAGGPLPRPADLASGLTSAAATHGHQQALTVLRPDRREEQGFVSLAQWAAKGAHLLELELGLGPGDVVGLDGPPGWLPAAVTLACWWRGVAVTLAEHDAAVRVVHVSREATTSADEVFVWGDREDATPDQGGGGGEPWAVAVQVFPDQPPRPAAAPDAPALVGAGRVLTQAELIDRAGALPPGRLGVRVHEQLDVATVVASIARPVVTGSPTVLVHRDTPPAAVEGERIGVWVED